MTTTWNKIVRYLPAAGLTAIVALALVTVAATSKEESKPQPKAAAVSVEVDDRPIARTGSPMTSFAPIVKKVGPSVVKVFTTTKARQTSFWGLPDLDDSWLRRFFGDRFDRPNGPRRFEVPPQRGIGSGVIVTKDGYILTNNHVVDDADEVKITLQDGREFDAKVIGKDPKTDVAVLKVEAKDLPFMEMADSDKSEVGDVVLAIGNPFGIGQTVTTGIISATGRATLGLDYEDFIQTDAAINPGNSGGALVDAEGRLIGINTAILSRSGGNQGIGFAIPTNLAREVMDALIQDGKVTRGYLGIVIQDLTPALAKQFKLKEQKGALVSDVVPKGPADKAGLQNGDVVLELDGKPVRDSRHLKLQVARVKPGTTVPMKVLREGATKTLQVTVSEMPGAEKLAKTEPGGSEDTETLKGVGVTDLDPRMREQFNLPEHVRGAVVTEVDENSAAYEAGLRTGDVILEINRRPVRNAQDAIRLTEDPKERVSLLRVWSKGGSRYLVVDESKAR
jgi:serine protease Do